MPNHVTNIIELEGSEEQLEKLVEEYSTFYEEKPNTTHDGDVIYKKVTGDGRWDYDVGWHNKEEDTFKTRDGDGGYDVVPFEDKPDNYEMDMVEAWTRFPDLNKIVPKPEDLDITSGSHGSMTQTLLFGTGGDEWLGIDELQKRMRNMSVEERKKAVELGLQYQANKEKYGYTTWYDWSVDNWGTKWNTYSCEQLDDYIFEFQTAWSPVIDLVQKMSEEYPDVTIIYKWADEDTGRNVGEKVFKSGYVVTEDVPVGGSKQAYEKAFEINPSDKEFYELVDGEYEPKRD